MRHIVILIFVSIFFIDCANTPERPNPVMTQEQHDRVNQESAALKAQKDAQLAAASASGAGLAHYYCPNHPGEGAGAAGSCSQCGTAYTHNQAFHTAPGETAAANPAAATPEPAINTAGVWHYTCPNGHTGGSGSATACAECGTTLVHNTVYHNTPGGTDASTAFTPPTTPATPEPAINAAGVYHYICTDGHAGGGGSATPCGECGKALVHNTAYHN